MSFIRESILEDLAVKNNTSTELFLDDLKNLKIIYESETKASFSLDGYSAWEHNFFRVLKFEDEYLAASYYRIISKAVGYNETIEGYQSVHRSFLNKADAINFIEALAEEQNKKAREEAEEGCLCQLCQEHYTSGYGYCYHCIV